MKTTKTLIATAFAVSMAFWAVSCGDDSSSGGSGGNGGNGGGKTASTKVSEMVAEIKATLDSVDLAVATQDEALLDAYAMSLSCAENSDCVAATKARLIAERGYPGLDGECAIEERCLNRWSDSLLVAVEMWEWAGDEEYDQACRMTIDANGTCEEYAWKFLDAEAVAFGNTACDALYDNVQAAGIAAFAKVEPGRCAQKVKCTLQFDQAPEERGFLHAEYGYTKAACDGVDPVSSSSASGKSSASGGSANYDSVVHQFAGTSHCNEYWYDSRNSEQKNWAEQVVTIEMAHMESGPCPTDDHPVACDPKYQVMEGAEYLGTFKTVSHVTNIGWCSAEADEDE